MLRHYLLRHLRHDVATPPLLPYAADTLTLSILMLSAIFAIFCRRYAMLSLFTLRRRYATLSR